MFSSVWLILKIRWIFNKYSNILKPLENCWKIRKFDFDFGCWLHWPSAILVVRDRPTEELRRRPAVPQHKLYHSRNLSDIQQFHVNFLNFHEKIKNQNIVNKPEKFVKSQQGIENTLNTTVIWRDFPRQKFSGARPYKEHCQHCAQSAFVMLPKSASALAVVVSAAVKSYRCSAAGYKTAVPGQHSWSSSMPDSLQETYSCINCISKTKTSPVTSVFKKMYW